MFNPILGKLLRSAQYQPWIIIGASLGSASVRHDGSGSDQLHFEAACGPDEHNVFVNDSAYLIGAAITAIEFAIELAHVAAVTDQYNVSKWQDTIRRLSPSLPFDSARQFHPEFEGMDKSYDHFQAKQADTLMLQYPLMLNHQLKYQHKSLLLQSLHHNHLNHQ